jgi:broad specificity phosphatase PhoE
MNNTKTTVYLIRHGQSLGNLHNVCLGHTDIDLTELGYAQAELTAKTLANVDFAAIYSSDLVRARNTAAPHCKIRGVEPILSKAFRELYFGDWENSSVDYLKAEFSEEFTIGWRQNFGTFTPPNGECVTDMAKRMRQAVKKAAEEHKGENILIVSHAAAIRALWGEISGLEPATWGSETHFPSNASYSVLEYENGILIPVSYSNDSHLGENATNIKH